MFLPVFFTWKFLVNALLYILYELEIERRNRTVEFLLNKFENQILSSSSKSKTATNFENWIAITFFKEVLQESIS